MDKQQAKDVLIRYSNGTCTPEEQAWVESWYIQEEFEATPADHQEIEKAMELVRHNLPQPSQPVRRIWPRLTVAASILLFLSFGGWFLFHPAKRPMQTAQNPIPRILPGGYSAVLTLSNGKKINLAKAANGQLAKQGNTSINKTTEGHIKYSGIANQTEVQYNTLATRRGGTYTITLADGTIATLDAASSIRYPTVFNGRERRVEITGQVYFEVAHDKTKPFRVHSKGQTTEVLGTHFNINAYDDEADIKTTLLEGSVRLELDGQTAILKPGEQSVTVKNGFRISEVDTDEAVSWKNGEFGFNETDIHEVMIQVSRWYDADIEYMGKIPDKRFNGTFKRSLSITQALQLLEFTGVKYRIEGRKIIVK
jgi:transmembrane sensor